MRTMRGWLVVLALVALAAPGIEARAAETVRVDYSISVRGLPVGRGAVTAGIDGDRYTLAFEGGTNALTRFLSSASVSASASGRVIDGRRQPADYAMRWAEDDGTDNVGLHFKADTLAAIALDPPRRHPERYVPIPAAEMIGVIDPLSLFLWPTPQPLSSAACGSAVRLVDGKRRFDFVLSYARTERVAAGAFKAEAIVCAIRYRQVAGHRIDKPDRNPIRDAEGMEIWLAAVTPSLALPVRLSLQTESGRMVLDARAVEAR